MSKVALITRLAESGQEFESVAEIAAKLKANVPTVAAYIKQRPDIANKLLGGDKSEVILPFGKEKVKVLKTFDEIDTGKRKIKRYFYLIKGVI